MIDCSCLKNKEDKEKFADLTKDFLSRKNKVLHDAEGKYGIMINLYCCVNESLTCAMLLMCMYVCIFSSSYLDECVSQAADLM